LSQIHHLPTITRPNNYIFAYTKLQGLHVYIGYIGYTDVSKYKNDHLGISVNIPTLDFSISFRISNKLSIYTGELFAIFKVVEIVTMYNINKP